MLVFNEVCTCLLVIVQNYFFLITSHILQLKHGERYLFTRFSFLAVKTTFTNTDYAANERITGCWVATHLEEAYCNVCNPQLFPPHAHEWRLHPGRHLSCMDWHPFLILLIRSNVSLCMLSVHGYAFTSAPNCILL